MSFTGLWEQFTKALGWKLCLRCSYIRFVTIITGSMNWPFLSRLPSGYGCSVIKVSVHTPQTVMRDNPGSSFLNKEGQLDRSPLKVASILWKEGSLGVHQENSSIYSSVKLLLRINYVGSQAKLHLFHWFPSCGLGKKWTNFTLEKTAVLALICNASSYVQGLFFLCWDGLVHSGIRKSLKPSFHC